MKKPELAIVGSSSMIGSRFCEQANWANLIRADLKSNIPLDITDKSNVNDFFQNHNFDWLVLFSAFTDVDAAEKQRNQKDKSCWQINVEGVKNVVKNCLKYKRKLIFISTDFVFDGTSNSYCEDDHQGTDISKVCWYGITKIEAEKFIQKNLPNSLIVRIAYPYRGPFEAKDDIAKRILRLYKSHSLYPMFADQAITPTFIDDLAPAILLLINKNQAGTFHVVSPIPTTQYEFAKKLISKFNQNPKDVKKGNISQYLKQGNVTPRPIKGILKAQKITELGFAPTDWESGINKIYEQSHGQLIQANNIGENS